MNTIIITINFKTYIMDLLFLVYTKLTNHLFELQSSAQHYRKKKGVPKYSKYLKIESITIILINSKNLNLYKFNIEEKRGRSA